MHMSRDLLAPKALALTAIFTACAPCAAQQANPNDLVTNFQWTPGANVCATRLYGTVTPIGAYPIYSRTFKMGADGQLPSAGSLTIVGFNTIAKPDKVGMFYARSLGAKPGQTCAEANASNEYDFSKPSNFVAHSELVDRVCAPTAPDSDGDGKYKGLDIFKNASGFCDNVERLVGSSVNNPYSSGNTVYSDGAKYVLVNAVGGLPGGTQGEADPGNALCPNGKKVLKTNACNPNTVSDAEEIAQEIRNIPTVQYDWKDFAWNG